MPHVTLEHSSNINIDFNYQDLFSQLHGLLHEIAGIQIDNFKSRAIQREQFLVGDGKIENAFVHLEIRVLEGRSPEMKKEIGQGCLRLLKDFYAQGLASLALQLTVEIVDLPRENYYKYPEGTL